MPLVSFYTTWKQENPWGFFLFSGVQKVTSGMKWSMSVIDLIIVASAMTFEFVRGDYALFLDDTLQPVSRVIKGNQTGEHMLLRIDYRPQNHLFGIIYQMKQNSSRI